MKFLRIAGNDLRTFFKSRLFRLSIVGIIIVPVLYSLLYLKAFWDPYGSLENMKIAVVNLDKGAISDGKVVNYGNDVVESLKNNDTMGWEFVSEKTADEGLEGKEYYAKFQIDEDFSKNVLSAKDGNPEKASMQFVCNQGKNYLASQIASKVEGTLKASVVSSITESYVTETFSSLYDAKLGMNDAAEGSSKITDGLVELNSKVPTLTDGANQLSSGSSQLYNGQVSLNNGLISLNSGAWSLNSGIGSLYSGAQSLNTGLNSLNSGLTQINDGVDKLNDSTPTLSSGVDQLYLGSKKLVLGIESAKSGSSQLSTGANQLYASYENTILPTIDQLQKGSSQLEQGLQNSSADIQKLKESGDTLNTASDGITNGSQTINDSYVQVKAGLDQLINSSNQSSEVLTKVSTNLQEALQSTDEATKNAKMMEALNTIKQYSESNQDAANQLNALSQGSDQLKQGIESYNDSVKTYTTGVKSFALGTATLIDNTSQISNGVSQINGGLTQLQSGLNTQFGPGLSSLNTGINSLDSGITTIGSGASELSGGLSNLNGNVPTLVSGVSQLKAGTSSALTGSQQLYAGSGKLLDGTLTAYNGSKTLAEGTNSALDGSNQLVSGQKTLNDGVNTLSSSVPALATGVNQLTEGSTTLTNGLSDGYTKLDEGLVNSSEDMGKFVSEPVKLKSSAINPLDAYGPGLAPYFMNLSLWVGALMMFFVIVPETEDDENTSRFNKVIGKFISLGAVGVFQALLVGIAIMALGLKPTNMLVYFGTLIFFSFVYIAIIQCLITLTGDVGRLLSIICLLLQLTACGGTFPLELEPTIFRTISKFMPFNYSVEILRNVISATNLDYSMIGKNLFILLIFMLVFLTITIVNKNLGEKFNNLFEKKKEQYVEISKRKDASMEN